MVRSSGVLDGQLTVLLDGELVSREVAVTVEKPIPGVGGADLRAQLLRRRRPPMSLPLSQPCLLVGPVSGRRQPGEVSVFSSA